MKLLILMTFFAASVNAEINSSTLTLSRAVEIALAHWVNPHWLWLTTFVGANLLQSSITKWCLAEKILIALKLDGGKT